MTLNIMTLSEFNEKLNKIEQLVPSSKYSDIRVKALIKYHNMLYISFDIASIDIIKIPYLKSDDKDNLVKSMKFKYVIHYGDDPGYTGFKELRRTLDRLEQEQNAFDRTDIEVTAHCDDELLPLHKCSHIEDITLAIDTASGSYTALIEVS